MIDDLQFYLLHQQITERASGEWFTLRPLVGKPFYDCDVAVYTGAVLPAGWVDMGDGEDVSGSALCVVWVRPGRAKHYILPEDIEPLVEWRV